MRKQTDEPYKPFRKNLDVSGVPGRSLEREYQEHCHKQGISQTLKYKYRAV